MERNKKLTPFKLVVLQNFPYIEADFDALTNYGTMCKIVEYLNKTIEQQNLTSENTNALLDWFENLDVQDEIDDKLDRMAQDGTLTQLIRGYIDPIIAELNQEFDVVKDEVASVVSGGPAGVYPTIAALQQADPDHTRIYLVEQDGEWYFYNNNTNQWKNGGVYQATGVADGSIDILKLSKNLKENYSIVQEKTNINPVQTLSGWCRVINNSLQIETDTTNTYEYKIFNLENDTIYDFYGWQIYSLAGLIIYDSTNNKVLYASKDGSGTGTALFYKGIYKTPKTGNIKAYCSYSILNSANHYITRYGLITKYNEIKLNKNYYNQINKIDTNNSAFIQANTNATVQPSQPIENFKYEVYALKNHLHINSTM